MLTVLGLLIKTISFYLPHPSISERFVPRAPISVWRGPCSASVDCSPVHQRQRAPDGQVTRLQRSHAPSVPHQTEQFERQHQRLVGIDHIALSINQPPLIQFGLLHLFICIFLGMTIYHNRLSVHGAYLSCQCMVHKPVSAWCIVFFIQINSHTKGTCTFSIIFITCQL